MGLKTSSAKAKPLPPGVYTPVITIYSDAADQPVDLQAMYAHGQHLVNSGMHGLVYLGTNGELALLSGPERQQILRNARKMVTDMGLPDYPIVAGISAQSTVETIQLAKEAGEAGAGWGLLLPPSYWAKALPTEALVAYYRDVADASPIPVVIYNFPGVTSGIDLDSDQLAALASHPNIVATKLTCGNVGKLTRLTSKFEPPHFGVYGGSSDYLLPTLHTGGNGCVTGMGNIFPKSTSRIYDYWAAGQLDKARELQDLVANAEWACKKSLACTKYGAWWYLGKQLGIENEQQFKMRKPYLELKPDLKKWTTETLSVLEEMEKSLPGRQVPN
ncbi:dihydrodipicolinate synthase [Diaporthe amygdali]|uniref:dihydrodipicolinate synthase n=1 Tax=Phomopsis amygdali TaxID=1214568 RepID=UPI0022FF138A|nr:dihydrodipicolinate synthase [Diaporthe amygdali]KAJ0123749.1 dihydrodipicolinate synthase [Diaporthe amygdali]